MSGETRSHRELKRAALCWAQVQGYRIAALEVGVPNSSFRADVAAYRPEGTGGRAVIFECKQSRPDFLNDSRPVRETLERLEELHGRRRQLERQLGVHYPNLRVGESLFPEYDAYAFDELPHKGYRRLMRDIRIHENRVYGKTKFDRLVRYECAHLFYLVTTPDVVKEHEVPMDWGWLEADPLAPAVEEEDAEKGGAEGEEEEPVAELRLRKQPVLQEIAGARALQLLHRLGVKATGHVNREAGISYDAIRAARRGRGLSEE